MSESRPVTLHRYRIVYARGEELRYVGHLDMQTVWERTLRRARVPVAFSQGFNPRPRFHIAAALPLGFTSRCEIADVWLTEEMPISSLLERLQKASPPGLSIQSIIEVPLNWPALQTQVSQAEYSIEFLNEVSLEDLQQKVQGVLAQTSLPRLWRKKSYDLRPLIHAIEIISPSPPKQSPSLRMVLSAQEGATGRPEEVLSTLGIDSTEVRVERTRLLLD
jgi:radical SAM-linked protein